jgi:predicted RNase H-like nuclease
VDHRTLIRATEDFAEKQPGFALNCGLMALYWICAGRAYEVTTGEVLTAYTQMLRAAKIAQCTEAAMDQLRKTLESFPQERFVRAVLAPVLANKPSVSEPDR